MFVLDFEVFFMLFSKRDLEAKNSKSHKLNITTQAGCHFSPEILGVSTPLSKRQKLQS